MWKKSSFCKADQDMCVEVNGLDDGIGRIEVRSSQKSHVFVSFTADEWDAFVAGAKRGEFDLPKG
jgi:hypothetical protein